MLLVHHSVRPDIFKDQGSKFSKQDLEELLEKPNYFIYVYEAEQTLLGHIFFQLRQAEDTILEPIKTLFIDDLCVASQARGKQIGQKLYDFALHFAKEQGCYNLTLDVWADNQKALRFYERLGLQPQKLMMETILKTKSEK